MVLRASNSKQRLKRKDPSVTMTTNRPDARGTGGSQGPRRWWQRRAYTRTENTDLATMLGALSVVCFWALGVGIVLGLLAITAAVWAVKSEHLTGEHALSGDTWLAIGSGVVGVIVGLGFVAMVLPNW